MKKGKAIILIVSLIIVSTALSACSTDTGANKKMNENNQTDKQPEDIINFSSTTSADTSAGTFSKEVSSSSEAIDSPSSVSSSLSSLDNQVDLASTYSQAILHTNYGDIKVAFYSQESPLTVNNFLNLAKSDFFNQVKFHRVIKGFMIQGGDPNSKDDDWSNDGYGGPGYKFKDEINSHKLVRGSIAMANSGPNTNGSQFFIVTAESTPFLDGGYTNFGYVVDGMSAVDAIENLPTNENDHPTKDAIISSVELVK